MPARPKRSPSCAIGTCPIVSSPIPRANPEPPWSTAFVTLALNRFFKGTDGLNLDVGAFVSALEYGTQRHAELIGKPSPAFFEVACASLGVEPSQVMMIGDDLESDALGGQSCGLKGVLVRTGKFRAEAFARSAKQPNAVLDSVADLPKWLFG